MEWTAKSVPRSGLTTFVAVAALIGLTVAGASAILFRPGPTGDSPRPYVVLSAPEFVGAYARIDVLNATPAYPLAEYGARLLVDNASAGELNPLKNGGSDGFLSFSDMDGNTALTPTDRFTVERGSVGEFVLFVYWRGGQVGLQGWREAVALAFAPESPGPSGYTVDIATASPPRPLGEYGAILRLDLGRYGRIGQLSDRARDGNLSFSDRDGSGTLTAGDRFEIDLAEPGTYTLLLTWRATELAQRTWTRPVPPGAPTITFRDLGGSYLTAFGVTVNSSDPELPLGQYRAVLFQNGMVFRELNPLRGGAMNASFRFWDKDYDGNFSAGDRFAFDCSPEELCPGALPAGYHYVFRLYWGERLAAMLSFDR